MKASPSPLAGPATAAALALSPAHRKRLREVWGSAGWPCQDMIELDLLAAGLLMRVADAPGRERLQLTDSGVQQLAASRARLQRARSAHEALVDRVALDMHRAGRVVWCGLSLRAALAADGLALDEPGTAAQGLDPAAAPPDVAAGMLPLWPAQAGDRSAEPRPAVHWALAMPDVYSVRHTTREDQLLPVAHEIKVSRADLLSDLKRPAKGQAYRALSSECWYVLQAGIGEAGEIPDDYGVMVGERLADSGAPGGPQFGPLTVLRPARRRPFQPPFALWMALARAAPRRFDDEPGAQWALGRPATPTA